MSLLINIKSPYYHPLNLRKCYHIISFMNMHDMIYLFDRNRRISHKLDSTKIRCLYSILIIEVIQK